MLLALAFAVAQEAVAFEAPVDTKPEALAAAAKVIAARCAAYGYKKVAALPLADAVPPKIKVTCELGISKAMMGTLEKLCSLSGKSSELRFTYTMGPAEQEQFKPARKPKDDTAPDGAKWYRLLKDLRLDSSLSLLLRNDPSIKNPESSKLKVETPDIGGGQEYFYELDAGTTKKLGNLKSLENERAVLLIDQQVYDAVSIRFAGMQKGKNGFPDYLRYEKARLYLRDDAMILEIVLRNPMQVAVKLVK